MNLRVPITPATAGPVSMPMRICRPPTTPTAIGASDLRIASASRAIASA